MATQAITPPGEPVSIGRVLSRSFAVIAANPLVVLGIAFAFGALPSLALGYVTQRYQLQIMGQPDYARDYAFLTIGSGLIGFVLAMLVQGALVRVTVAHVDGQRAGFGESIVAALRVLFPLILLSIAVAVAVAFGLMLFLVPGVMLYIMWAVASPALVEERGGVIEALGRSRRLTKGARWKIFGLQLIVLIVYWIVAGTLGYAAIAAGGGTQAAARIAANGLPPTWLVVNALVSMLINTFWSTTQTALYVELRDWKDGPTGDHLADVFA